MGSFFNPPDELKTELGRVRVFSPRAGIRVSPLQLGAMSIGEAWSSKMGSMTKEQSFSLLDAFYGEDSYRHATFTLRDRLLKWY